MVETWTPSGGHVMDARTPTSAKVQILAERRKRGEGAERERRGSILTIEKVKNLYN